MCAAATQTQQRKTRVSPHARRLAESGRERGLADTAPAVFGLIATQNTLHRSHGVYVVRGCGAWQVRQVCVCLCVCFLIWPSRPLGTEGAFSTLVNTCRLFFCLLLSMQRPSLMNHLAPSRLPCRRASHLARHLAWQNQRVHGLPAPARTVYASTPASTPAPPQHCSIFVRVVPTFVAAQPPPELNPARATRPAPACAGVRRTVR